MFKRVQTNIGPITYIMIRGQTGPTSISIVFHYMVNFLALTYFVGALMSCVKIHGSEFLVSTLILLGLEQNG